MSTDVSTIGSPSPRSAELYAHAVGWHATAVLASDPDAAQQFIRHLTIVHDPGSRRSRQSPVTAEDRRGART